jgi:hypothetical protein
VLVAVAACAVAGAASAQENRRPQRRPGGEGGQPPGGTMRGGMMGGGGIMLLSNESVQKELKVTDEQKEKLKKFAEDLGPKMRERMQGAFQGGGGGDREAMMAKAQEAMKKLNAEAMKELADAKVLDDGQMKRFKQIQIQSQLQREGPGVFAAEEVQKSLKLTDDQKDKLKGLAGEMRKDMGELGRGFDAEAMQKRRAVTKEYTTKAMETLTDEQKSAWKELTGAPFEVKFDVRAGGERRPGGEGGDTPRRRPGGENRPPRSDNPPPA